MFWRLFLLLRSHYYYFLVNHKSHVFCFSLLWSKLFPGVSIEWAPITTSVLGIQVCSCNKPLKARRSFISLYLLNDSETTTKEPTSALSVLTWECLIWSWPHLCCFHACFLQLYSVRYVIDFCWLSLIGYFSRTFVCCFVLVECEIIL